MSASEAEPGQLASDPDATRFRSENPEKFKRYLARRKVVFLVAYVGYTCAYLVRNNFKLVSEDLRLENDWSLTSVGLILTGFTLTYGFAKFFMGMVADRTNLRRFFAGALGLSALICIGIGFIHTVAFLFAAMLILGLVQGALAPSSMAMIANWYPNRARGSGIAIWNTSQNLGGAGLPLIIIMLLAWAGPSNLAVAFWNPGIVVLGISFLLWKFGGDKPETEGLGSLGEMYGSAGVPQVAEQYDDSYWQVLKRHIFTSRLILTVAFVNALLYFLRFGILNWMPAFLGTEMGFTQAQYAMAFSILEWIAIPGSFFFAWLSYRLPNKQSIVGFIGLLALAALILFYMGNHNVPLLLVTSGLMGALIYGPQLIVNIMTLNFVPLKAAGVAVGFVGLFGYIVGEMCANIIMPVLAEIFSWQVSLMFLAGVSVLAGMLYMSLRRREAETITV